MSEEVVLMNVEESDDTPIILRWDCQNDVFLASLERLKIEPLPNSPRGMSEFYTIHKELEGECAILLESCRERISKVPDEARSERPYWPCGPNNRPDDYDEAISDNAEMSRR